MENCLFTKLKSVVNNDNLDKFEAFKLWFKHPTTTTGFTTLQVTGVTKAVIVEGDSYFCDANGDSLGKTVTAGNGIDTEWYFFRVSNAVDCTIELYSKYIINGSISQTQTSTNFKFLVDYKYYPYLGEKNNSTLLYLMLLPDLSKINSIINTISVSKRLRLQLDARELSYDSEILNIADVIDNIDVSNRDRIKQLYVTSKDIVGSISQLSYFPSLTHIILNNAQFLEAGSLKNIGSLTELTSIGLYTQTLVGGSLEEFVQAQIAAGRTTGEISMPYIQLTKVTWKGSQITGDTTKPKVSWTASAITYYADGTTPDTVNL